MAKASLRTCSEGHRYYKSSDCPACPVCEAAGKPAEGFLSLLSAPARRALETAGILSLQKLASYTEKQILQLHGVGKTSIPVLAKAMKKEGFVFAEEK